VQLQHYSLLSKDFGPIFYSFIFGITPTCLNLSFSLSVTKDRPNQPKRIHTERTTNSVQHWCVYFIYIFVIIDVFHPTVATLIPRYRGVYTTCRSICQVCVACHNEQRSSPHASRNRKPVFRVRERNTHTNGFVSAATCRKAADAERGQNREPRTANGIRRRSARGVQHPRHKEQLPGYQTHTEPGRRRRRRRGVGGMKAHSPPTSAHHREV